MSQAKVDRYKYEKANRKEIMKKEKAKARTRIAIFSLVVLLLAGWLGYSGVQLITANQPSETIEVDYSAVSDFMNSLEE